MTTCYKHCPVCGTEATRYESIFWTGYHSVRVLVYGCPHCMIGFNDESEWGEFAAKVVPIMSVIVNLDTFDLTLDRVRDQIDTTEFDKALNLLHNHVIV